MKREKNQMKKSNIRWLFLDGSPPVSGDTGCQHIREYFPDDQFTVFLFTLLGYLRIMNAS
jgi:hypothetical protein